MTNQAYKEILKLDQLLTEAGIPHVMPKLYDGWRVCYPAQGRLVLSAVEHRYSYGQSADLIEIMGLMTEEELKNGSVLGWQSADEVFRRIKIHWEAEKDEVKK